MRDSGETRTVFECVRRYFFGGLFLMTVPVVVAAGSLELEASKDKMLCERVLALLQKNIGTGGRVDLDKEPFSQIVWEPVSLAGVSPKVRHYANLNKTLIN